jgi:Lrp/AsnC family transcriptional regulator for asnA, asnC and gidA
MTSPQLDHVDRQLIDILSRDARVSNRKIATDLGVTEGTVRGRIKRLQQDRLIAFTAITSIEMEDPAKLAFIGIQADIQNIQAIARQIADLQEVNAVIITMGRFSILAVCLFHDLDQLLDVASNQILAIPGVHHIETSIAVKTLKYNPRIARITDADHSLENGD